MPRTGSRLITVDGTDYRWRLRGRPTYDQGLAASPATYAVEHAERPGATLVVATDQPHCGNWMGREGKPVHPADVAAAVRLALRQGWEPTAPGAAYRLDLSEGFEPVTCCRPRP